MVQSNDKAKAKVLAGLMEVRVVTHACSRAGVPTSTFYRWRQEDPLFDHSCDEAREIGTNSISDMAELVVISKARKGDLKAAMYLLEHHHRDYMKRAQESPGEFATSLSQAIKNARARENKKGPLESYGYDMD